MDTAKYFLAIVLPSPSQQEVMALKEYVRDHYESKAALRSPAHITLHMPFEFKLKKEELLIKTLRNFRFSQAVDIELKNYNHFEDRVIYVDVVPNQMLEDLQNSLVQYVKRNLGLMNEAKNMRGFHPHATIAFRDLKTENFRKAWTHFQQQEYQAKFTSSVFHLLKHSPGRWDVHQEFNFLK